MADVIQHFLDLDNALGQQAPVGFDLCLARAAKKAETAALTLKVGPGSNQAALLVDEVREFDLQPPFPRPGAFAEDLEDQPGPVQNLGIPGRLEIALLNGR